MNKNTYNKYDTKTNYTLNFTLDDFDFSTPKTKLSKQKTPHFSNITVVTLSVSEYEILKNSRKKVIELEEKLQEIREELKTVLEENKQLEKLLDN